MNKRITILGLVVIFLLWGLAGCRMTQQDAKETEETRHANYVGSEVCGGCHSSQYAKFAQSGHPFKLTKVVNGMKPMEFPFTILPDIPNEDGLSDGDNTLGPPSSYADVSYVIGGFKWKARFVDKNGFIITGNDTQYNYETRGWVAYSAGSVDKPYNCGKCHTTGWEDFEDNGGVRQDGLPGMDGTFFKGGIHCEECHGPGAAHVNSNGDPQYITKNDSSDLCGRCHTRDEQQRIEASSGLIKHHEQFDELQGKHPDSMANQGRHLQAGVGCNTCHDPHATTVFQDMTDSPGVIRHCEDCHADKVIDSGPHSTANLLAKGLLPKNSRSISNCYACHMPKMAKSAVGHDAVGTGPKTGDISSHIFKIDLTKTDQFTPDGKFAYPWITGQYACKQCHNGVYFFNFHFPSGFVMHK